MDKAKKELKQKLVDKFNIDFTHPEYISGDKQLFYALLNESEDDYKGSQEECKVLQAENDSLKQGLSEMKTAHAYKIKSLEEIKIGQKCTITDLERELVKVRSTVDKLTKQQAEDQNALALAHEEIQGIKEVAAEWEHRSKSVRKIPLLGTDTLSYQSDFILRWQEHTKEWNDLVSDFQNKYLPVLTAWSNALKEAINSFILRVKNVEI